MNYFIFLMVLMGFDYVTGLLCAFQLKSVSSSVGFIGITKKLLMISIVGISYLIDTSIIGEGVVMRTASILYYASNEIISITENLANLGVPLPPQITKFFAQIATEEETKDDERL